MDDGRESALTHVLRLGIVLACLGFLVMLLPDRNAPLGAAVRASASIEPGSREIQLVAALILAVAGIVMLVARIARRLAVLAIATSLALALTLASASAGSPQLQAVAIAGAVARVPLAILLVALILRLAADAGGRRLAPRRTEAVLLAIALVITAAELIVYDPAFDPGCVVGCSHGAPLVAIDARTHLALNRALDAVTAAAAIAALVFAGRWLIASSGRPLAVTGAVLGAAGVGVGLLVAVVRPTSPPAGSVGADAWPGIVAALAAGGSAALALGTTAWAWRTLRLRLRMERAAAEIALATGDRRVEAALVDALGVGPVRVTFPLPDGTTGIDGDGAPVAADPADATGRVTPVLRDGAPIAFVHHPETVDAGRVTGELTPSMLLALDIERLRAVGLANLRLLRESRSRIVTAQDAERRRVERDLHDGAQQRILAVAMDLRLARTRTQRAADHGPDGALATAEELAFDALEQLRRLARGVHPAILSQGGLGPALSSLAEEAPVPMTLDVDRVSRLPPLVEAVTYRAVADTLHAAARSGATEVAVAVRPAGDDVTLDIELDGTGLALDERLVDRVGAAGGRVVLEPLIGGRHRIHAVLPCA